MSLTSWIDIFGAISVAHSPVFAHIYHDVRRTGVALRLFQLIECKNRIMCVISKIVYLEELKASNTINHIQLYSRVIALSIILNKSQLAFKLNYTYFGDTILVLNLFLENIFVIFRIITRIYFYSVVDSTNETAIDDLVNDFTTAMHYIALGFECALVCHYILLVL